MNLKFINSLTVSQQGFTKANQALNYHFWLSTLEPIIRETERNKEKGPGNDCRSFDFRDVQFAYPLAPNNRVLKGVSLKASMPSPIWSGQSP